MIIITVVTQLTYVTMIVDRRPDLLLQTLMTVLRARQVLVVEGVAGGVVKGQGVAVVGVHYRPVLLLLQWLVLLQLLLLQLLL